ncbi:MAG: 5-oxoprolinase subunit PxpB [Acidobacteria bacterium]|nr:5-oxoprolinase subunit PxpB [Acidobacteriota bacterium]
MDARLVPAGDAAWLIELPERLDAAVNARAIDIAARVTRAKIPVVRDVVVGFRSVMVYVDPLGDGAASIDVRLRAMLDEPAAAAAAAGALVDVPVCYEPAFAPDLPDVAMFAGCDAEDVIARHLAVEYRVFVVGFVPGFAYMAPVDPRIAAPRRPSPRLTVPAGSVAIAAGQTGIYPAETPGGWNIIGRSPVKPFAPDRAEPFLFRAGDRVRFHRIPERAYRAATEWGDA